MSDAEERIDGADTLGNQNKDSNLLWLVVKEWDEQRRS
jgi:hypothetical protein